MAGKEALVIIDIGSTKICTILANAVEGEIDQILGVGLAPSMGMQRGIIVDVRAAKRALQESIERTERASGFKIRSAYVGISGKHVNSINNRVAVSIAGRDHVVTPEIIKQAVNAANNVTPPEDRQILHAIPRKFSLDGEPTLAEPMGMHGFKLEVESHLISVGLSYLQNLQECLSGAGIAMTGVIVNPLVSGEAVLTEKEKGDGGAIVVDIGGGTADIIVFKEGSPYYTASLPVGGIQISKDLSIGLGVPFEIAEDLKEKYGSLTPTRDNQETIWAGRYEIPRQDLNYIIQSRVEEILRLVYLNLPRPEKGERGPSIVVLTGGTANLLGIDKFAERVFQVPVRIGVPERVAELAEDLTEPVYATGVGLLLWGAKAEFRPPGTLTRVGSKLRGIKLPSLPKVKVSVERRRGVEEE